MPRLTFVLSATTALALAASAFTALPAEPQEKNQHTPTQISAGTQLSAKSPAPSPSGVKHGGYNKPTTLILIPATINPISQTKALTTKQVLKPGFLAPIIRTILSAIAKAAAKTPKKAIGGAVKKYGKTAVKKALKAKLLTANSQRWSHIFAPKHKWRKVGAQWNKGRAADLLTQTVSNGKIVRIDRDSITYELKYAGNRIQARTARATGEISNGWVK